MERKYHFLEIMYLLYCLVLMPRMMPRNQSTAIRMATAMSVYGISSGNAINEYRNAIPGRIYCTIHFMMLYVLSDMSSGMIS